MPNPHFDVKIISRKAGQSAVAAAAYRSGENLYDSRVNKRFNYTNRDRIPHTEIMLPGHEPDWASHREQLWNQVEAKEKRKDAQLARDIIAGLPRELTLEQNIELVRNFVSEHFTSQGMIADFAIHESEASDGGKNPHVHIMTTTREVTEQGFGNKNRAWNAKAQLHAWRDGWETATNQALEQAGREERVSLKSYKEQEVEQSPQVHMGDAHAMEQKGIETDVGDHNRQVQHENALRKILGEQKQEEPMSTRLDMDQEQVQESQASPSAHSPLEKHQNALRNYFSTTTQQTAQTQGTLLARLGLFARSVGQRMGELLRDESSGSRNLFSRGWAERVKPKEREQDMEWAR